MRIREGDRGDLAFIRDLGHRSAADSASALRPADPRLLAVSFERMLEVVLDRSHLVLIAEIEEGESMGFLLLLDAQSDDVTSLPQAFVAYMAVEPSAHRRGVGAALLARAEEIARERGLPHLTLMVTEGNIPARELYAQAGYSTERRLLCKAL
ncbi:MAG TPA: GNAT family N-acetyltransferase [Candidatus Baltobacteraceae bacterium]|jgi:GNAT superfamily N-acetyltransferase|nr:GNAT family N-acetyltransferase [Candidatus Baltobacteraceae bacterium]